MEPERAKVFILATVALSAVLVGCAAVAFYAYRGLRQWNAEEDDQIDGVVRNLAEVEEAVRATRAILHRPKVAAPCK
jgi:hypothetical protein